MFKINDRVRLKHDNKENPSLTVRSEVGGQRFLCISDCGQRMVWACDHELELVERNADLKQAIREVLLSEQFLREFAKAFVNTPRPSTIQAWSPITGSESEAYCLQKMERERQAEQSKGFLNSGTIPEGYRTLKNSSIEPRRLGDLRWNVREKRYIGISEQEIEYANRDNWAACRKVEPAIKQSLKTEPPDGWRFLEVGEILRRGDTTNTIVNEMPESWIGSKCVNEHFALRRNRFEVGEKVVEVRTGRVYRIESYTQASDQYSLAGFPGSCVNPENLAPYIEDAK